MTREEAIEILKTDSCMDCAVGAQSPCTCEFDGHCDIKDAMEVAIKALEQEPRKGHWIETKEISTNRRGQIVHEVICSECSGIAYFRSMGNKYIGANLCPNCGAQMESEKE